MILITGANGFLGKYIQREFDDNDIITLSRRNSDYEIDIGSDIPCFSHSIDLVVHCAGKAHVVPKTEADKREFFRVNTKGCENLLRGLEDSMVIPERFVFISSVAVYGVRGGLNIDEEAPLMAKDPYGYSKILAEFLLKEWCEKHNVKLTILRLPLVIGDNADGNLARMINGIQKGRYFRIGSSNASKSMVLASDIAKLISSKYLLEGIYNLTDDTHPKFNDLEDAIAKRYTKKLVKFPLVLVYPIAYLGTLLNWLTQHKIMPLDYVTLLKITKTLTFSNKKAKKMLKWKPKPVLGYFNKI